MTQGTMRASSALRHVEHLATLGLHPHIAIPEMLRTLSAAAAGTHASFAWIGSGGRVEDACHGDGARPLPGTEENGAFRLRLDVAGRTAALISVTRATPLFERERRLFRAALPMLKRAMAQVPPGPEPFHDVPERTGVLVCTAQGRLVSADTHALLLLAEMDGRPLVGGDVARLLPGDPLPSVVADTLRRATRSDGVPAIERVTRWGAFRAQVFAQSGDGAAMSAFVLVLSKHLPRRVALMRALEQLDLSPRERQVAFHLGNGVPAAAGAAAMGVSITTWRSYVKRVYVRLDVRDRLDLFARLNLRAAA